MSKRFNICIVALCVSINCSVFACAQQEASRAKATSASRYQLNQDIDCGDFLYRVLKANWYRQSPVATNDGLLLIRLRIKNNGPSQQKIPRIQLITKSGAVHHPITLQSAVKGAIDLQEHLDVNKDLYGEIGFDIPHAEHFKLKLASTPGKGFRSALVDIDGVVADDLLAMPMEQAPAASESTSKSPSPSKARGEVRARYDKVIRTGGGPVAVGANKAAYDKLTKASVRKDESAFIAIFAAGLAWEVADGTRVKVTDPGIFSSEILIQSGPHSGKRGIIASDFLK